MLQLLIWLHTSTWVLLYLWRKRLPLSPHRAREKTKSGNEIARGGSRHLDHHKLIRVMVFDESTRGGGWGEIKKFQSSFCRPKKKKKKKRFCNTQKEDRKREWSKKNWDLNQEVKRGSNSALRPFNDADDECQIEGGTRRGIWVMPSSFCWKEEEENSQESRAQHPTTSQDEWNWG